MALSRAETLVQGGVNMRQNGRITGRAICSAAALAISVAVCGVPAPAAFASSAASAATRSTPAAFASSAVAPAATRSAPRPSPQGPDSVTGCVAFVAGFYPEVPNATIQFWCNIPAAASTVNHYLFAVAVGICVGGLVKNGVDRVIAQVGCTGANAHLPFTEEQWCYGTWCLNAWGGGPYVNEYTGGVETNDPYQIFILVNENGNTDGSGYSQIMFGATGNPYSDDCIGDYNNNSGLADAGLVGCGSASGGQGWGTNMEVGTSGCPTGEAWFYDVHWNGYLGPGGSASGTHWYLNKPSAYCFSVAYES
jgi:hypothetical protein